MSFLELFKHSRLIGAHRGFSNIYPENTLSALKGSIGHCDFIEVDVQLSRDKVAIIMHDETLERTTNVKELYKNRKPYRVTDFSYNELCKLDYGAYFYKNKRKSEPLLTLKKVLEFIKENQLFINLEIKDLHNYFNDEEVVSIILNEINNFDVENLILLSSFRHAYLQLCKQKLPNIPTAALVANKHPDSLLEYLKSLEVDAYHFNDKLVDYTTIKKLRDAGFYLNIYSVNDPIRAKELFDMGVNGVFNNNLDI